MNLRLSSLRAMFIHQVTGRFTGRLAAAAALAFVLTGAGVGSAVAAPAEAASAPDAASVSYAAGGQYTVKPGQSLNDVAIAVTQSRDRATLARASRALFDANPSAFMGHDPSRMRVGAVLTVPALDASGALAASAAVAGSGASAATAAAASAAPAPAVAAASAPNAAVAAGAASGASQVNAAAAPAMPAVSGTGNAASEASPAAPGSAAVGGAVSPAPLAGSQAAASAAGGAHVWSGLIQPSASEAAEGASASITGAAPAASAVQPASQPRAQVSSLQQLLALKNRVLMELQKHGIGGAPATTGTAPTSGVQAAAGASSAAAVSSHDGAAIPASNEAGMSQTSLSVAATVGAALVALLAALRLRRAKRERLAAAEAASADGEAPAPAPAESVDSRQAGAAYEQTPGREASDVSDDEAVRRAAVLAAAEREAAEGEAAAREMAERIAAEREAEIRQAASREAAAREAAERAEAERLAAAAALVEQAATAEQAAAERAAAERALAEQAATEREATERALAERAAAEHAAAERVAAEQAAAERAATEQAAAERAAAERAAAEQATAERTAAVQAAEREAATRQPPAAFHVQDLNASQPFSQEHHAPSEPFEPTQPNADIVPATQSGFPSEPLPAVHPQNLDGATTAASLAAAAELGAEALPRTPLEPVNEAFQQEQPAHRLQWEDEHTPSGPAAFQEPQSSTEPQNPLNAPSPATGFAQQQVEPYTTSPSGQPYSDTSAHPLPETAKPAAHQETARVEPSYQPSYEQQPPTQTATPGGTPGFESAAQAQPAPAMPTEFPRDAADAFGSLDMPLPPRVESTAESVRAAASTEAAAQRPAAPHDEDDAPHIAGEIAAGTASRAAVAGLGAAGFGALKLDFDLELPPSPAQPLPAFTQADLVRIARNKLDLAAEYIELGDLSGARVLINEVIEANDPATRTEARALLSTLAPLS